MGRKRHPALHARKRYGLGRGLDEVYCDINVFRAFHDRSDIEIINVAVPDDFEWRVVFLDCRNTISYQSPFHIDLRALAQAAFSRERFHIKKVDTQRSSESNSTLLVKKVRGNI